MKLTALFTSTVVLSLSNLISATSLVDQGPDVVDKIYVNALGEEIAPALYPWGHFACKEKHAAGHKVGGNRLDASGRLGKRQQYCPSGYTLACDAYSSNPCCPSSTPICCSGANVCCKTGQFCQGVSTCCDAGQVGCGEACCNYGETCCGEKCCGSGFTCNSGTCTPPTTYTAPTSSSSSTEPPTTYTYRAGTGSSTYINTVPNNTETNYYYNTVPPPYTVPTTCPTGTSNPGGGGGNTYNSTTIGAISGSLSALSLIFAGIAAWFYKKKTDAEHALAAHCADQPPAEKPPYAPPPAEPTPTPPKEQEPYAPATEGAYVERPITGTPGLAGHGGAYQ